MMAIPADIQKEIDYIDNLDAISVFVAERQIPLRQVLEALIRLAAEYILQVNKNAVDVLGDEGVFDLDASIRYEFSLNKPTDEPCPECGGTGWVPDLSTRIDLPNNQCGYYAMRCKACEPTNEPGTTDATEILHKRYGKPSDEVRAELAAEDASEPVCEVCGDGARLPLNGVRYAGQIYWNHYTCPKCGGKEPAKPSAPGRFAALADAAERAIASGDRRDVAEYLRLRRKGRL